MEDGIISIEGKRHVLWLGLIASDYFVLLGGYFVLILLILGEDVGPYDVFGKHG